MNKRPAQKRQKEKDWKRRDKGERLKKGTKGDGWKRRDKEKRLERRDKGED